VTIYLPEETNPFQMRNENHHDAVSCRCTLRCCCYYLPDWVGSDWMTDKVGFNVTEQHAITLTPLTYWWCRFYNVFGITQSGIEPTTSRSRGERSTTELPLRYRSVKGEQLLLRGRFLLYTGIRGMFNT